MMPTGAASMNALCQAAEAGQFPRDHKVHWVKSGAAPLAPELARRFTALTKILVCQGYGMTEASPVTHVGFLDPALYRPDSIGHPWRKPTAASLAAEIDPANPMTSRKRPRHPASWSCAARNSCSATGTSRKPPPPSSATDGTGPATSSLATRRLLPVVDRRKEMIKYKGFAVAPAEVEAVLLEHPAVKECGVVGRRDDASRRDSGSFRRTPRGFLDSHKLEDELCVFVADRLTHYKQPREVHFVESVPKTASGKILRRELRKSIS